MKFSQAVWLMLYVSGSWISGYLYGIEKYDYVSIAAILTCVIGLWYCINERDYP